MLVDLVIEISNMHLERVLTQKTSLNIFESSQTTPYLGRTTQNISVLISRLDQVFCVKRRRFFPSQLVKCSAILQSCHCSITVRLSGTLVGLGAKHAWAVNKLNRHAACIIEGRSIRAVELKSTLGWPSLQARRNYLKCIFSVFRESCLHTYLQSLGMHTFSMAITPEAVIWCALPL